MVYVQVIIMTSNVGTRHPVAGVFEGRDNNFEPPGCSDGVRAPHKGAAARCAEEPGEGAGKQTLRPRHLRRVLCRGTRPPAYGARPLSRYLEKYVTTPLSRLLIAQEIKDVSIVRVARHDTHREKLQIHVWQKDMKTGGGVPGTEKIHRDEVRVDQDLDRPLYQLLGPDWGTEESHPVLLNLIIGRLSPPPTDPMIGLGALPEEVLLDPAESKSSDMTCMRERGAHKEPNQVETESLPDWIQPSPFEVQPCHSGQQAMQLMQAMQQQEETQQGRAENEEANSDGGEIMIWKTPQAQQQQAQQQQQQQRQKEKGAEPPSFFLQHPFSCCGRDASQSRARRELVFCHSPPLSAFPSPPRE
ncbi:unnamed protein product [Vitrella brassicaformis CCMP3155]|uniref:Clp ATPase C-terminal domain-containing protein n=1 Tax=Vitrella brassicaformis (strain CCMP3155) TaxID=1169540 RepID=A0A0G4GZT8_VITBC|nr:unnamed protein product [Vitrella brassicaformis CCMP3155]|eukprot:CEM36603.1 unnamed protein product [Vitrella brassicaformis CCMP3155]